MTYENPGTAVPVARFSLIGRACDPLNASEDGRMIPENRRTEQARSKSSRTQSIIEQAAVLAAGTTALIMLLVL
jgi:hypothetical protein